MKENNSQKQGKLKVIAFKLPENHVHSIKDLCSKGFYPSLSETVRIAITDYICHVLEVSEREDNLYWLSIADQDTLQGISLCSNKISACTKMPNHLLKTIDNLISSNQQSFNNRTDFIRLAISKFLKSDSAMYDYWLKKNLQSNVNTTVKPNTTNHVQVYQKTLG